MTELRKCIGFDPTERTDRRGDHRSRVSLALAASHASAAKVRRWKDAARFAPPTATTEHMPFKGHRTCAEWR